MGAKCTVLEVVVACGDGVDGGILWGGFTGVAISGGGWDVGVAGGVIGVLQEGALDGVDEPVVGVLKDGALDGVDEPVVGILKEGALDGVEPVADEVVDVL